MKRWTTILLAAILAFSLTACGGAAYDPGEEELETLESPETQQEAEQTDAKELAQEIYQILQEAGGQTRTLGEDLCAAWKAGLEEEDALLEDGVALLDKKVSLDAKELTEGAARRTVELEGHQWERLSQRERADYRKNVNQGFVQAKEEDRLFGFCIETVLRSYQAKDIGQTMEDSMREVRTQLRKMGSEHSDSPYGEELRHFYNVVGDYYAWCIAPHGTYQEAEENLTNYRTQMDEISQNLDPDLAA